MRIDRWNGGDLRRYHLPSGAILVTSRNSFTGKILPPRVIPAFCHHISVPVSRQEAVAALRAARA